MRKEPIRRGYMYLRRIQRDLGAQGAEDGRYMYRYVLGCVSNVSWPKWLEYIRYLWLCIAYGMTYVKYLERIEDSLSRCCIRGVSGVYRECFGSVVLWTMYRGCF